MLSRDYVLLLLDEVQGAEKSNELDRFLTFKLETRSAVSKRRQLANLVHTSSDLRAHCCSVELGGVA